MKLNNINIEREKQKNVFYASFFFFFFFFFAGECVASVIYFILS